MKRMVFPTALALLLFFLLPASTPAQESSRETAAIGIEERIKHLEEKQAEIYHTLEGQKAAGLASRIAERLTLSGLLEIEAAGERVRYQGADTDSASDMSVATAYLAFGAEVSENFSADLSFLFEEGETDLEVDEATVNDQRGNWKARVGRQYLPFGVFYSHFVSDPLTLELGETRATALLAGYGNDLYSLSAFVFNGSADRVGGESHLDDWGASLVLTPVESLTLGGSYLSDLADTDAQLLGDDDPSWNRRVTGWSAFAIWAFGPFDLAGEYLGAARSFDADDALAGTRPRSWNIEAGYDLRENIEIALRYEGSREFFGHPKRQYGAVISWSPVDQVSLSFEYLRGKFDIDQVELINDRFPERRDLITAQLALEF